MAKKQYLDLAGLTTYNDEIKGYVDNIASGKANSSHNHSGSEITTGTVALARGGTGADLSSVPAGGVIAKSSSGDKLSYWAQVPIERGGTGAATAAAALTNLGLTATAAELNYVDGVTSNIQTQLDGKLSTSGGTISGVITTTDGKVANRDVTTNGTFYYGGTGFDDGAFLGLYGKDQSNYKGQFRLKADNGEAFVYLEGMPSGQLRWNNKTVATLGTNSALAIADGGTGMRSDPSMLVNLASTSAAGVFATSPRPGVTGTLPIANGGTGATTAETVRTNLGFTYGTTEPSGTPSTGEGSVYFRTGGDAVIEVGTNGIWTYRKWASGIAECWGNGQYAVDCTTAAGTLYYGTTTVSLPSGLFSETTYSVNASCGTSSGAGWPVYGRTGSPTVTNFNAAFYNTASASSKVINVQFYIVGRWK